MYSVKEPGKKLKSINGFKVLMFDMGPERDDDTDNCDSHLPIDIPKVLENDVRREKHTFLDKLLRRYENSNDATKDGLMVVMKNIVPKLFQKYGGDHAITDLMETMTRNVGPQTLVLRKFRRDIIKEIKKEKFRWETIDVLGSIIEMLPGVDANSEAVCIENAIKLGERLRRLEIFRLKLQKQRKVTAPKFDFVTPPSDAWRHWCEILYYAKEDIDNKNVSDNIPSHEFLKWQSEFLGEYDDLSFNILDIFSSIEEGDSTDENSEKMKMALGSLKEFLRECTHVTIGISWTMDAGVYVRYGDWAFVPEMKILRKGYNGDFPVGKESEEAYWALAVFYESMWNNSSDESTSS